MLFLKFNFLFYILFLSESSFDLEELTRILLLLRGHHQFLFFGFYWGFANLYDSVKLHSFERNRRKDKRSTLMPTQNLLMPPTSARTAVTVIYCRAPRTLSHCPFHAQYNINYELNSCNDLNNFENQQPLIVNVNSPHFPLLLSVLCDIYEVLSASFI